MKIKWHGILMLIIFLLGVKFFISSGKEWELTEKAVAVTYEDARVSEPYGTEVDFTEQQAEQQKEEYYRELRTALSDYDKKIRELNAKSASLKETDKTEYLRRREEFKQKRKTAYDRLEELKNASTKAWGDVKRGMDAAMADLSIYYDKELSQYR